MLEEKKVSFEDNITPEEYISLMFERTDEDGFLYIPWYRLSGYTCEEVSCRCQMNWNLADYEKVIAEFNHLYDDLVKISKVYNRLGDDVEENKRILNSDRLFRTWNMFVRKFDLSNFNDKKIDEISDKIEVMENVKTISKKIADAEPVDSYEKLFLKNNIDVCVSMEEEQLYDTYLQAQLKEAKERVGDNICAYTLIVRSMRLCKLLWLQAPDIIVNNEAKEVATALVIHNFAELKEDVDDSIRKNKEKIALMTDEELDQYYRPQKTNTRKSMAPLYIYRILQKYSNNKKHLKQQEILKILSQYPYEITMERKALSRILHNLLDDEQLGVFSDKEGVWIP